VIDPQGVSCVVNLTGGALYSDEGCLALVAFPQTISAATKYYSLQSKTYTLSAKFSGNENANGVGLTLAVFIGDNSGQYIQVGPLADQAPDSATYPQIVVARDQTRMHALGATDRDRSRALARVAYEDAASLTESWANLTAWTLAGTPGLQVSGGKAFSTGQGGGSGATRPWALGTTGTGRAVFNYTRAAAPGTGGVIIGVSKDASGATPSAGGGNAIGIYLKGGNNTQVMNQGTATDIPVTGILPAGNYIVTVTVDAVNISLVIVKTDGTNEQRAKVARAGFNIQTLYVFNSDANQLTGSSIGALGARQAIATVTPRAGIEGVGRTIHWSSNAGNNCKLELPPAYDSRTPVPLVIAFHGNSSDENLFTDNAGQKTVGDALVNAGFAVLSAAYSPGTSTWGAQGSLDAYYAAYKWTRDNYAIGPVALYGNSMGGIESLLTLAERRIPGIVAWVGMSPAFDLANAYANATFTATINAAYGIPGSGTYAAQTAGHDPALMAGSAFRGLPMRAWAATDDATVPKVNNADPLMALVAPFAVEGSVVATTGGHSFDMSTYVAALVAFLNQYFTA
jgi:hypothetical protein